MPCPQLTPIFFFFFFNHHRRSNPSSSSSSFPSRSHPPEVPLIFIRAKAEMMAEAEEESDSISRLASPFELIRNCDLPPPQKLFPGIDEPPASVPALLGMGDEKRRLRSYAAAGAGGDGKLELLRALRLSQTRAREAEERGAEAASERDALASALIWEAARASAYRRWAWLLEHEVAALRSGSRPRRRRRGEGGELRCRCRCERLCGSAEEGCAPMAWMVAFAIPLGIAGVGLALACRFLI